MKKLVLLTVMSIVLIGMTFAQNLTFTYYFEQPQLIENNDGFTEIVFPNCLNYEDEGNPFLPYYGVNILLPQGEEIINVRIISSRYSSYYDDIKIIPASKQFPISIGAPDNYKPVPNPKIYNSDKPFPLKSINDINTGFLSGHSIGSLSICPLIYIPAKSKVKFLEEITIKIETASTERSEKAVRFLKESSYNYNRITKIVDNPSQLIKYSYETTKDYDEVDILLITKNSLISPFDDYIEYKKSTGFIVEAESTEDIYSNYSGQDEQEKIRNCIIDYYENFNISFVILGGDSDPTNSNENIIPHRGFYAIDDLDIPSDMYYACLDGNWNNNGNNKWGEVGEYDLYAELGIGRICIDNADEIQKFTNKLHLYQDSPVIDNIEKALMIGEELNNNPWTFGGDYKDQIAYGSSAHGFTTAAISANFTITTLYDRDGTWNKYDIFDQFNNTGVNLLNHLGHSSPTYNMRQLIIFKTTE
ncbi:MAG: hypothetical protein K8R58_09740 [Bacteroidales bacterium]|nr:hypothetical protein [Bacteroidales bacterium]